MEITDDDLVALLDRYHQSDGDARRAIGEELFARIDRHFRERIRPALVRQFGSSGKDSSVRYSVMVQDFFTMVLDRRPDGFWRAKSLRALRTFASRAIANDMLDVLRRRKQSTAMASDELEELAAARAKHFHDRWHLDFEWVLGRLTLWDQRSEPWPQRARVIRHRYVDGMDYDEIIDQEGAAKKQLYELRDAAIEALRDEARVRAR